MTLNLQSSLDLVHDESFVGQVVAPVDHGLVIIEEPESSYRHDEWDPRQEYVSAGPNSVYLSVRPSVDGPVEIGIARTSPATAIVVGEIYFEGTIETSSGWISVHDADDLFAFMIRCRRGENSLKVFVDRQGLVARMLVLLS